MPDTLSVKDTDRTLEQIVEEGIADIERGNCTLITGPEDRRLILERWLKDSVVTVPERK